MKRIRMKRQIVVDGQVVREEIVEKLVSVDTDTTSMVAEMDTELGHASKEEIATWPTSIPTPVLTCASAPICPIKARNSSLLALSSSPRRGGTGRDQSVETVSSSTA